MKTLLSRPIAALLLLLCSAILSFAQIKNNPKNAASNQPFEPVLDSLARALHGWQAEISTGSLEHTADFREVYASISGIRNAAISSKQYTLAARATGLMAESLDSLLAFDLRILDTLIKNYGAWSKWSLYARDFATAERAALRAMNLAKNPLEHSPLEELEPSPEKDALMAMFVTPDPNWVRAYLGHSYLLRNDWAKAQMVYEQYLRGEKDVTQAKGILLKDFDALQESGITSRAMKKARKWLAG